MESIRTTNRRPRGRIIIAAVLVLVVAAPAATAATKLISGRNIADGSIRSADLRNLDVRSIDIAPNAIISSKVKNGSIYGLDIANESISSPKIRNGAVTSEDLATGAVTSAQIAAGAVGGAQIAPAAVDRSKLAAGAVGSMEIEDGSVQLADLAPAARPEGPLRASTLDVGDPIDTVATINGYSITFECTTTGTNRIGTLRLVREDATVNWGFVGSVTYGPGASIPGSGDPVQSAAGGGSAVQSFSIDSDDVTSAKYDLFGGDSSGPTFVAALIISVPGAGQPCYSVASLDPVVTN